MKDKVRDINFLNRPNFRYVSSAATDIRATIRREQRRLDALKTKEEEERQAVLAKRSIGAA